MYSILLFASGSELSRFSSCFEELFLHITRRIMASEIERRMLDGVRKDRCSRWI